MLWLNYSQCVAKVKLCIKQVNLCLQVLNGSHTEIAALYNMTSNTFVPYHITEHPFCGAHTLLPDGRAIIVGGKGMLQS